MVKHGDHQNTSDTLTYNRSNLSNTTDGIPVSINDAHRCHKQTQTVKGNEDGEFEWEKELQGLLLGGYYWGYSSGCQIVGGWLCQRYGARKTVTLGMLPLAIGNLLSPVAVRVSPYVFLVIRILSGVTTGVMFPSVPVFLSRWSRPDEWNRLLSTVNSGGELGNAVAFPINGLLCKYGGWELPFYVMGSVCLVWCIVWILISRDSPSQMPGITEAEKQYIEEAIGHRMKRTYKTPWRSIFRSRAFWACVSCHVLANVQLYILFTQGPTYLKEVMNFDISSNGFFSCLSYLAMFILIIPAGAVSDCLSSKGYLSVGSVRKLMNSLGMVIPAIFLLALAYVPCSHQTTGVALYIATVGTSAFCYLGHLINMADIAVMHSGTLFGISNTFASFPGIIAPYVVAYVTKQGTQEEWRTAFYIGIICSVVGAAVFLFFSSGSPQPWALPQELNITASLDTPDKPHEECQELQPRRKGSKVSTSDSSEEMLIKCEQTIPSHAAEQPI